MRLYSSGIHVYIFCIMWRENTEYFRQGDNNNNNNNAEEQQHKRGVDFHPKTEKLHEKIILMQIILKQHSGAKCDKMTNI